MNIRTGKLSPETPPEHEFLHNVDILSIWENVINLDDIRMN
jgi:hypothetical protein